MEITKLYEGYPRFLLKPLAGIAPEDGWNKSEVEGFKQYELRSGESRYTVLVKWKAGKMTAANVNHHFIDEKILQQEIPVADSRSNEALAIKHLINIYEEVRRHAGK